MSDESLMPLLTSARRERDSYRDAAVRGQKALEACEAQRERLKEENDRLDADVQHLKLRDPTNECREENEKLRADRDALLAVAKYADHGSWRCGHPDRYGPCSCGLLDALAALTPHLTRELE